jgi:hypothetical protein
VHVCRCLRIKILWLQIRRECVISTNGSNQAFNRYKFPLESFQLTQFMFAAVANLCGTT